MRLIRLASQSKYVLFIIAFIHGAMLMAMVFFALMSAYEDRLYDQIVDNTIEVEMNERERALALLNRTHELLKPRLELFGKEPYINVRDTIFRSSDIQLIDAKGACGSHAHVLGRLLQRAGIEIRIAQMKCGDQWGCHILLEANLSGNWVALDALYNLSFTKSDGNLASFKEVGENWQDLKSQVPEDYELLYSYDDVRYTNWDKIPVVMPAIKRVLSVFKGDEAETFSLRSVVLNSYKTYLVVLSALYLLFVIGTVFILKFGAINTANSPKNQKYTTVDTAL